MMPSKAMWTAGSLTLLLAVVASVYWPGLHGGFAFDDYPNIVLNTNLHVTRLDWDDWMAAMLSSGSSELQRPLAMLTFAVNHYLTGLNPWPMKLTNLVIHLINTGLTFGLVRCLLRAALPTSSDTSRCGIALFVAASWALMPINLMPVLLIVQRMESLSQTFVLAGLWLYVLGRSRQRDNGTGWSLIVFGILFGTGLGALSKESAVLLPLYAFFIELFVFRFRRREMGADPWLIAFFVGVLLLPALLGLAWLAPRYLDPAAYAYRNFNLTERLLTEPRVLIDYLHWTLAPDLSQLSLFHDDYPVSHGLWNPPGTMLAMLGLAALACVAWLCRAKRPLSGLGVAWFLSAHLLTATFIPLELVFEHRNYFASLGISLALADLLLVATAAGRFRDASSVAAVLLVSYYAASTHFRVLEWSNPIRFAMTEAAKHPESPRATYQLAQTYSILSKGRRDSPFMPAAFAAYEAARKVPGAGITPAQGALMLAERSATVSKPEWWREIQARLRAGPIGPQELGAIGALTDCAIAKLCRFPPDEMLAMYSAALSHGDNTEVLNIYGNYALNVLGDVELTERLWTEAHRRNPREPQYVISLAKLMIALDRMDAAREQIGQLRAMGRLGQFESSAQSLEIRLNATEHSRDVQPEGPN